MLAVSPLDLTSAVSVPAADRLVLTATREQGRLHLRPVVRALLKASWSFAASTMEYRVSI